MPGYVVSLTGYVPTPRFDGVPWASVTIGEAATSAGPFSLIDTIALSPLDTDPTVPRSRSFTTAKAVLLAGWYLVTFLDAAGNQEPTTPVAVAQAGLPVPSTTGTIVVSFTDINPPVRNDGLPWVNVRISEAASLQGPWTVIDAQPISPVDADPSLPIARSFSTKKASVEEGFYTLTFFDAAGGSSHPVEQVQDVPSQIRPSLSELGSFVRARTVVAGTGGTELGTFNANTRPTDMQARAILDQATNYVLAEVGEEIPDRMLLQARFLVVLYAAQIIEVTFYRDEVNRGQSAFAQYELMYKSGTEALKSSIADRGPAAASPSFTSVPVLNAQQAHWQRMFAAFNAKTGVFDPSKLGPEEFYPMGRGGIPGYIAGQWPWLYGNEGQFGSDLAFLED